MFIEFDNLLAIITIAIFLVIYDPKTTICLIIFLSSITYLIDKVKKDRIRKIGIKRFDYNRYIIQILGATFKGIKEIKANQPIIILCYIHNFIQS